MLIDSFVSDIQTFHLEDHSARGELSPRKNRRTPLRSCQDSRARAGTLQSAAKAYVYSGI